MRDVDRQLSKNTLRMMQEGEELEHWKKRARIAEAQVSAIRVMSTSLMGSRTGRPYALAMIEVIDKIRARHE